MAGDSFNTAAQDLDGLLLQEAASKTPNLSKMKQLIDAGANVNARDEHRRTVLMLAAGAPNAAAVALLVDNGADMYAQSGGEKSANAMAYAIGMDDIGCVRAMLDRGFDPNREPCHGKLTPVMLAARLNKRAIAEELTRRGADIHAKTSASGMSAVELARDNLKPHVAERLLAIDADLKEKARRAAEEEKNRIEQERIAAARHAFDAVCDAGLPIERHVKPLKRISFKQKMPG